MKNGDLRFLYVSALSYICQSESFIILNNSSLAFFDYDVLLDLFGEDIVQNLLHLFPEFGLLVLQVGGHQVVAFHVHFGVAGVHEVAVGPAVGGGEGVDFDDGLGSCELFGVEDVENGAGVVDGREGELVVVEVHRLELHQHVVNGLGEGDVLVPLEVVEDVLRRHILMSHLQRNHHQRDRSLQSQDLIEGVRVEEDVELGGWRDISLADGSAHHDDFADFGLNVGVAQQQNAEIGEGASVDPNDLAFVTDDTLVNPFETELGVCLFGRSGQMDSSETVGAVHVFGQFHLSLDEGVGALEDGDVPSANVVENVKRILGGVSQISITRRGGDAEQVNFLGVAGVDDGEGIVQSRIAVKPERDLFFLHFWTISNFKNRS